MKKMFNFSVLLSLCFSIINTECSVSSDIRNLAVSLIDSPKKEAACILLPLNMLSIYSAFKEYKNYKNNFSMANAIKEDPVYNFYSCANSIYLYHSGSVSYSASITLPSSSALPIGSTFEIANGATIVSFS